MAARRPYLQVMEQPTAFAEIPFSRYEPPLAGTPLAEGARSVQVRAYCGFYVGGPRWQGTSSFEPDECTWEAVIALDADEWAEGHACVRCPDCNAELFQREQHFTLVP